jgi:pimeloyl-ACP methyl ester carboxylesterase
MATLDLSDVQLNYQMTGGGAPVTMIHGLGTNMAFWYLGPGRMMNRHNRLLMYDLRGHGVSSVPASGYTLDRMCDDLLALHDELGITSAHLVGHSYGARVALAFAARYPERVRTLTIADTQIRSLQPPMRLRDWPYWERWKKDLSAHGTEGLPDDDELIDFRLLADLGQHMGRGGSTGAGPGKSRQIAKRRINMNSRKMGDRGRKRWETLLATTTAKSELQDESPLTEATLRNIAMPTFLIYGKLSHCVPTSEALCDIMPNARRVLIPEVGHFFPVVKPRLFVRAFERFLEVTGDDSDATVGPTVAKLINVRRPIRRARTSGSASVTVLKTRGPR